MDRRALNAFRARLCALQAELEDIEASGTDAEGVVELDPSRVGRLSRMDALQGRAMSVETGRRRRLMLRKITQALARTETGDYGDCLECGEPVPKARLDIDPAVEYCIDCAQAREQPPV